MHRILMYIVVSSIGLVCMTSCGRSLPTEQQQTNYRETCSSIITWLQQEYEAEGQYPDSLPTSLRQRLKTFDIVAEYRPYRGNAAFEIRVGNYRKYDWEYSYDSNSKTWILDH